MIDTKGDWKNIGLAKLIKRLRQDLDIFELIDANGKELKELGRGQSYFGHTRNSAVNLIALQICKIYEEEKPNTKGDVKYELNSIDGVMKTLTEKSPDIIDQKSLGQFIATYSNSSERSDLKLDLASLVEEFKEKHNESIERFKTHRDKYVAHSEQGFSPPDLPSYDAMEQLFDFAHDFYRTITSSFVGGCPDDFKEDRRVKEALKTILGNHGLKEIKNELGS